jgi:hypothetical protein
MKPVYALSVGLMFASFVLLPGHKPVMRRPSIAAVSTNKLADIRYSIEIFKPQPGTNYCLRIMTPNTSTNYVIEQLRP